MLLISGNEGCSIKDAPLTSCLCWGFQFCKRTQRYFYLYALRRRLGPGSCPKAALLLLDGSSLVSASPPFPDQPLWVSAPWSSGKVLEAEAYSPKARNRGHRKPCSQEPHKALLYFSTKRKYFLVVKSFKGRKEAKLREGDEEQKEWPDCVWGAIKPGRNTRKDAKLFSFIPVISKRSKRNITFFFLRCMRCCLNRYKIFCAFGERMTFQCGILFGDIWWKRKERNTSFRINGGPLRAARSDQLCQLCWARRHLIFSVDALNLACDKELQSKLLKRGAVQEEITPSLIYFQVFKENRNTLQEFLPSRHSRWPAPLSI